MKKKAYWAFSLIIILTIAGFTLMGEAAVAEENSSDGIIIINDTIASDDNELLFSEAGEAEMDDYAEIFVLRSDISVDAELVDNYILDMANTLDDDRTEDYSDISDISDELVREYSLIYFGVQYDDTESLRQYISDTIESNNLRNAVFNILIEKLRIISYPEKIYSMFEDYAENELAFYTAMSGEEAEEMAAELGYDSKEELILSETKYYTDNAMLIDKIIDDLELEIYEEELDSALESYLKSLGYDTQYTTEEFKELSGETWLYIFNQLTVRKDIVYEALADHIKIVDEMPAAVD